MTTRIIASQISVPTANVGQSLVGTANGTATFSTVTSEVASARSVGVSLVFS